MAKKVEKQVEEVVQAPIEAEEQNALVAMVHKVLLAGIGAVALTQEEIEKFVAKLVERGELAEKDGKKVVHDVMAKRKKEAKKAEEQMDKQIEGILARMNVPSKGDIEGLSAKITELSQRVDELKKG